MTTETCFHCTEPIRNGDWFIVSAGIQHAVCCAGCQAVAQLIVDSGQSDYYRRRRSAGPRADSSALTQLDQWLAFDSLTKPDADGVASSDLLIEGMHCSACSQLIERQLEQMPGIVAIRVDSRSGRAALQWRPADTALSAALQEIVRLGYRPHPLDHAAATRSHKDERDDLLKRLAVAGIGMMQVTMFATATYLGAGQGMDPAVERLLRLVSMLVATPVVFYAGAPFMRGAWLSLRAGQPNMDVPVTLALLLAYTASCISYFRNSGATYFESATMFVFLLLSARLITMFVRHRALDANLALLPLLPDVVIRIASHGDERIRRAALQVGDLLRVRPGDAIAADGTIMRGNTNVNEALLTGESALCARAPGDRVLAGSVNVDGSIEVRATATAGQTRVAQMATLLTRAQQARPHRVRLANQVADYFVRSIIVLAALVFLAWWKVDPGRAFGATLAVLVVTCPCALALAIPTALSAAAARLAGAGLLVNRLDALETLTQVNLAIFDKTGTLSVGQPALGNARINAAHPHAVSRNELLGIVAALERHSNHPFAAAFEGIAAVDGVRDVVVVPGLGVKGRLDARHLRVGNADFVQCAGRNDAAINVADQDGLLGRIEVIDRWRVDARQTIGRLQARGLTCEILSGDRQTRVDHAVASLGVDGGTGELQPEAKLATLRARQHAGAVVLAVGDGVNDGALLAGADVSVAMAGGADLAKAGADVVMTGQNLAGLCELLRVAEQVRRVIRQNLTWAVAYNVLAVPVAAFGYVGPGLAALGMSLSSLVVILNAARVARSAPTPTPRAQTTPAGRERAHGTAG